MTGRTFGPASLIGRLALWSLGLLVAIVSLFWVLFSDAADRVSREVVDTRLLEFADQVRGYWVSVRAEGTPASTAGRGANRNNGYGPILRGHAGGADLDWIWQISVSGRVAQQSELLVLTGNTLPVQTGPSEAVALLRDIETPLGPMRVAERVVDEPLPFQQDRKASGERMHYLVGLRTERYLGYVQDHANRLRGLALLAVVPVALALFSLSAVIILMTRRNLENLAGALQSYSQGEAQRVEGRFPSELQDIVDRLNALIGQNEKILGRTRKYVSKIAHDINHPLAIMRNALSIGGDPGLMRRQVDRMAGLVDRYSSLARAIGPEGQRSQKTRIEELLTDIVDGFSILYRRTPLHFEVRCDPALSCSVPRHDLEAMVSNLVSNAHKYGESRIRLSAAVLENAGLIISVEDDGPGIPEEERSAAVNWGKRLDEAPPGTGFGLSIVQDIADLYEGDLAFAESDLGGLKASIRLPRTG